MNLEQMTLFDDPLRFLSGTVERRRIITQRRRGAEKRPDGRGRHENSLAAGGDERLQAALTGRRAQIVAWLREHGPSRPGSDRVIGAKVLSLVTSAKKVSEPIDSRNYLLHNSRVTSYKVASGRESVNRNQA